MKRAGSAVLFILATTVPVCNAQSLCPDGSYIGGSCNMAPDGSYVGGDPQLAPDGTYVGEGDGE